jgi:hypothetical protein
MTVSAFTHIKEYQREGQNMKIPFFVTKKYKRRKRKKEEKRMFMRHYFYTNTIAHSFYQLYL